MPLPTSLAHQTQAFDPKESTQHLHACSACATECDRQASVHDNADCNMDMIRRELLSIQKLSRSLSADSSSASKLHLEFTSCDTHTYAFLLHDVCSMRVDSNLD